MVSVVLCLTDTPFEPFLFVQLANAKAAADQGKTLFDQQDVIELLDGGLWDAALRVAVDEADGDGGFASGSPGEAAAGVAHNLSAHARRAWDVGGQGSEEAYAMLYANP